MKVCSKGSEKFRVGNYKQKKNHINEIILSCNLL